MCKEYILVGAARCSFCGEGITWSYPQKQIAFSECPYCGYKGDVEVGAMQCPGRHDFGICDNHLFTGMMAVFLTAAVGGTYCKKCNKNVVNKMCQKMREKKGLGYLYEESTKIEKPVSLINFNCPVCGAQRQRPTGLPLIEPCTSCGTRKY
jgi:hypothetical protein